MGAFFLGDVVFFWGDVGAFFLGDAGVFFLGDVALVFFLGGSEQYVPMFPLFSVRSLYLQPAFSQDGLLVLYCPQRFFSVIWMPNPSPNRLCSSSSPSSALVLRIISSMVKSSSSPNSKSAAILSRALSSASALAEPCGFLSSGCASSSSSSVCSEKNNTFFSGGLSPSGLGRIFCFFQPAIKSLIVCVCVVCRMIK